MKEQALYLMLLSRWDQFLKMIETFNNLYGSAYHLMCFSGAKLDDLLAACVQDND